MQVQRPLIAEHDAGRGLVVTERTDSLLVGGEVSGLKIASSACWPAKFG
jgi:hypothetical protein